MSIHSIPAIEDAVRCDTAADEACLLGPHRPAACTPSRPERSPDELILQHLGTAVMLCWAQLPLGARDQILRQADDVIGLAPIPRIRNEIVRLMLRHAKIRWLASRS